VSTFATYAPYYDLLYQDKDYFSEAAFIHSVLERFCPQVNRVLDLGCGTGMHARHLAALGLSVFGVDASTAMVEHANANRGALPRELSGRLDFRRGDIRTIRIGEQFGCVLSLFHVLSYLTENEDLQCAFQSIRAHLSSGGICIVDCWYGPAVLNLRPSVRVKQFENKEASVLRIAEPTLHANRNVVDVNYTLWVKNQIDDRVEIIRETHHMRYLFMPEIELLAKQADLEILEAREWMTGREPGLDTWSVYFVLRG
jgi:SAM-dependent methyltransferase